MNVLKTTQHPWIALLYAVVLIATGCGESPKPAANQQAGEATAGVAKKAKGLETPADLLIYAGMTSPFETLGNLTKVANIVQPGVPDFSMMAPPMLQNEFRLASPAGIDLKKSIAFALFDQNTYGRDPSATLIGMVDQAKFVASLPKTEQKQNDEGNAYSYKKRAGAKVPVYVNFIGQHAVLTRHKDLFNAKRGFLETLSKHKFKKQGSVVVKSQAAYKSQEKALKKNLSRAKQQMSQQMAKNPGAGNADFITDAIDDIPSVLEQLESGEFVLSVNDKGLTFAFSVAAIAGTTAAQLFNGFAGTEHQLVKEGHKDAAAFASMAFASTDGMVSLIKKAAKFSASALEMVAKVDKALIEKVKSLILNSQSAMNGQYLFSVHPAAGQMGITLSALTGIKDKASAQSMMADSVKVAKELTAAMQVNPEFAKAASAMVPTYQENAYTVAGEPVTVIKQNVGGNDPVAAMFGGLMQQHVVISNGVMATAYGPDGKAELERLVKRQPSGLDKTPALTELRALGYAQPFGYASISPIKLLQTVKLGGMNPFAATVAGMAPQGNLGFVMDAGADQMGLAINIPVALLKDGMAAFMKIKGGM